MTSHDGDHVNRILKAAAKGRDGSNVTCDRCTSPLQFTGRERKTSGQTPMVVINSHCPNDECPGKQQYLEEE
ncbi:hypothetical protein OG436_29695 [Streptomyces caniferus]|uniref:hypothetical protein n=1 Tax=Streptomyces caniferus TaxID=285557 RepID=UPI002E27DE7A|nr:hypothetical protein [Streptomyces caniferus]